MSHAWKVGDWCFCEMVLQQIKEMDGDRVTSVTDSFFSMGGNSINDRCFPLDLLVKNISDRFVAFKNRIRAEEWKANLNWPDISEWFIRKWRAACIEKDNPTRLAERIEEAQKFARDVVEEIRDIHRKYVDGVALVRR